MIHSGHQGVNKLKERQGLVAFAWLSIAAATLIICMKSVAYWLTGSVGLLSDALESLVNLVAASAALVALTVAARPADEDHQYGHEKAEYLSSAFEGGMIFVAALAIAATAIERLLHEQPLEALATGLVISAVATVINLVVARILLNAGRRHDSIALEADAHHLMTDVWTSVGVLIGVGAVAVTGWQWLDPAVALAVAANILRTGFSLIRRSALGLMDTALPAEEQRIVVEILERYRGQDVQHHALRTRRSGSRRFIDFHVLVPGAWTVQQGHDLLEHIEAEIRARLANTTILTHLEPVEDAASWDDTALDRTVARNRELD
jgi:cation diffusion facilitator family transporter